VAAAILAVPERVTTMMVAVVAVVVRRLVTCREERLLIQIRMTTPMTVATRLHRAAILQVLGTPVAVIHELERTVPTTVAEVMAVAVTVMVTLVRRVWGQERQQATCLEVTITIPMTTVMTRG